ncbi:alanine dehydrogenase [Cystoisospora suis]|uniref:alanine dehydrogenase n=1 Tax=Cystoisospora suis TaxID=483139 RepID=A0A2C6KY00_9APIC|nr:alanine dehydrogenase [Cystoisospora suis]
MIIGTPTEVKHDEGRVGLTPACVAELVQAGHIVLVQSNAGRKACFFNDEYAQKGAKIVETAAEIYAQADMIVKVKEPQPEEWKMIRSGQVIFTYFHFCADKGLTDAMVNSGAVCISYETVQKDGRLPLLEPMSEVAGKMAVQCGAHFLETPFGGSGILLGGMPGVRRGRILVIGGGVVGSNAAIVGAGMGAEVVIMDKSIDRLRVLESIMPPNVSTRYSCEEALLEELPRCDLLVGAVLLVGCKAPKVVRKDHLKLMQPGSVIVDVAVDHGGCVETTRVTRHGDPVYKVDGVLHYGVPNMPAAVSKTSTLALTNSTLPYVLRLANMGWLRACLSDSSLMLGLNIAEGAVLHSGIADAFGLQSVPVSEFLEKRSSPKKEFISRDQ